MAVIRRFTFSTILLVSLFILTQEAKTIDPYKVLGVERNASQREIQKAFHKLSLQYHPDKNKNKGAQEKFSEINNAYDILSDEEKRKNYDLYGDEKGNPGFDGGYPGDSFRSSGQGQNRFTFRPGEWQNMGGQGSSDSFSFSFGSPGGQNSFGFGDIFSNLFGGDQGGSGFGGFGGSARSQSRFGGFGGSTKSQSGSKGFTEPIRDVNSRSFKKEVADQGITWLLSSYKPSLRENQYYESVIGEGAASLEGGLKLGRINCDTESTFCKEIGVQPRTGPRIFVYSYRGSDKGSLVEYNGDLVSKDVRRFCQDHLPRFSTRIKTNLLDFSSGNAEKLPRVLLLSTKKETPIIWRVLSGLYRRRFIFYDAEVHDVSDSTIKKLGVDALPAIIGWASNGEKHVLKTGISVKDLKSAVYDLSILLDGFEKRCKKAASSHDRKEHADSTEKQIPLLTGSNIDALCGEANPVCIIGAFKSLRAREKLEHILSEVSQKSLSRRRNTHSGSRDSISFALLDATKQPTFLNAFDKSGFKTLNNLLVAYKPRKGKFATFTGEMTTEEVERFIGGVLNGDIQFSKTRQKPVVK
ncbi:dnaJ protein ERDJ3A isoform X2 [Tripterygium wilfordii]|uniref:DnaJ protein ERDJ3A isoform X2 n=1 Tax=Tripterygium wilfordii TaxID=458696 RepID=A0A7J7CT42_TRIWF|nr:dnaJ protein ERDJ3A [Tripterygium wilfordii]KAF5737251.1 dnaJ protein ERDJ3A isoform X2 [Tripterygium wilfordii]